MKLAKRALLYLIAVMVGFTVVAEEKRVTFSEKLRLQDAQERKQLEQMVESATDEEYRSYLNTQLSQTMKATGTNKATIIVDVTGMQSSTTALKHSSEASLGTMKLKSLMTQAPLAKNNNANAPSTEMTISHKEWKFSNKAENRQFEQINIELGGAAVETLLNSPDVKDIFITTGLQYGTKYSAINTELGRFYPPIEAKEYDDDFLRKGYLDDLMHKLEGREIIRISVTLHGYPETNFLSEQQHITGEKLTESVLNDLDPNEFELSSKGPYGFVIFSGKAAIEQLSQDSRVDMISEPVR